MQCRVGGCETGHQQTGHQQTGHQQTGHQQTGLGVWMKLQTSLNPLPHLRLVTYPLDVTSLCFGEVRHSSSDLCKCMITLADINAVSAD